MGLGHSLSKAGNLQKSLAQENEISDTKNKVEDPKSEGACIQTEGSLSSRAAQNIINTPGVSYLDSRLTQGVSLVLDIGASSNLVCQNLRRPALPGQFIEQQKCFLTEKLNCNPSIKPGDAVSPGTNSKGSNEQGSSLTLEVVNGPSEGLSHTVQAESNSTPPLTLGRVPPSDMLLKDSEVSGKHAMINWNLVKHKWELVDMGSLNGTLVNSKSVHHPDIGSRKRGNPVELSSGDLITLGTASQILVQIDSPAEHNIPFGVGVASDPMALRRGGKMLPMEDVCYFQWPLDEINQFGVFGVCDGHGGAGAAKSAGKLLPEVVAQMLADSTRREVVLSQQDASDLLRDAFSQAEAGLDHYYEGCTATLLLVWTDNRNNFMLQCANVGDSACIVSVNGNHVMMTEDHRISSYSEKQRMRDAGMPMKDEHKRLHGINLGRMLGDRFLKEHDARFISRPYISPVVSVDQTDKAFALLASDGFWDVISASKAEQLISEAKERNAGSNSNVAAGNIATFLVDQARQMRTRDNTSVVFLDFERRSNP